MKSPIYQRLHFQVLCGISLGIFLGHFYPEIATQCKPLGDAFIRLIKMMVAPIIFCTIVLGIAKVGDIKEVGRLGLKSLIYFEIVSTLALIIGLIIANLYKPGVGMNVDISSLDTGNLSNYTTPAKSLSGADFLMNIIPKTVVDAFAKGEILQVLLISVLFGSALSRFGKKGESLIKLLEQISHIFFGMIGIIMKVAPIGAFGAMTFSVSQYGFGSLLPLGKFMIGVLITCILFITLILGPMMRMLGFNLWNFLKYLKEEIFIVLGTASSEIVLPRMLIKLENLGCTKSVVGLVIPTGYSFNLDGTSIYLTMACVFIAQATNTPLSLAEQFSLLSVLMLTSKGAAAVTGGGFVILAATLSSIDSLPLVGLSFLLGIDIFMSGIRAVTNLIGNGVATMVISKWEQKLDLVKAHRILNGETGIQTSRSISETTPAFAKVSAGRQVR